MKVVYFLTDLTLTGGSMTLYNFMNGLVQKGNDVYVVTTRESFKWQYNTYKKFLNKKNFKFRFKHLFYKTSNLFLHKDSLHSNILVTTNYLVNNYKKLNISGDILIATHISTADAVYKLGIDKKIILHSQHFEELMYHNSFDIATVKIYNNLPFNHIVNCSWLQKMFIFNYNIKPVIITPGMDKNIFNGSLSDKKYLNVKKIVIITYCDPDREFKGYEQQMKILEMIHHLHKKYVEIQIFGKDPNINSFKYKFLGFIPQSKLAEYYRNAHVAIMFSWYESFPLPPIEAMACGCAVISTKYGTEDYLKDNVNGKIINSFNIEESVKMISKLILNPEVLYNFAKEGKKTANKYSWDIQINKINSFLKKLKKQTASNIKKIQSGDNNEMSKVFKE